MDIDLGQSFQLLFLEGLTVEVQANRDNIMGHLMIEKEDIRRIGEVTERDQVEVPDSLPMEDIEMQRNV